VYPASPPPGQYGQYYGPPAMPGMPVPPRPPTGRVRPPGVLAPAICLIVVGALAFLTWAVWLAMGLAQVHDSLAQEASDTAGRIGYVSGSVFPIVGVLLAPFTAMAGVQMLRGRTRGFVLAGTFATLVPCTLCCMLGLPFGIWSLVVLMREDVKAYFR
jgi:hypothetical protein